MVGQSEIIQALNIPILIRLPINTTIATQCDQGKVEEC